MNKFHQALHTLIDKNEGANFDDQLEKNIQSACAILTINSDLKQISFLENLHDTSIRWKYISLSFHILLSIKNDESLISINYITDIKKLFQFIVSIGILPNLIPGVGIGLNKRVKNIDNVSIEDLSVEAQYYRLSGTVKGLLLGLKLGELRNFIITNHLNDLLASLLQLCYAPVKEPNIDSVLDKEKEFVMTQKFYDEIMRNRQIFQVEFDKIISQSYSPQVIQEFMFFYGKTDSPKWLKLIVNKILINKLLLNDGVDSLIKAILNFESLDTGVKWKQYDIIVKLLMTKPNKFDNEYYENITSQVLKLLDKKNKDGDIDLHFVHIVSSCIKYLFEKDGNNCEIYFLDPLFSKLLQYSTKSKTEVEYGIKTYELCKIIYVLSNCVLETTPNFKSLPYCILNPVIAILFHLFVVVNKNIKSKLNGKLKDLLIKYISNCDDYQKANVFESLLFGKETYNILQVNDNIKITTSGNDIEIKKSNYKIRLSPIERSEIFLELITSTDCKKVIVPLCIFLLEASIDVNSLKIRKSSGLLNFENKNTVFLDESTEQKLVCYKLLSELLENSNVHKHLQAHPEYIVNFIEYTLNQFIDNNLHKFDCDSEQYQNMFKLIMILNIICEKNGISESLKNTLNLIRNESQNMEMKMLIYKLCHCNITIPEEKDKSDYEKAIEYICDPFLPVRGHGLLCLAKLIEEKNPEACNNKQYILNVSQQFLKNDDSYIYLNAIKVLAALGDIFPETVINILTEEYSKSKELNEKDSETRMKIGEVLLRVIKSLGDAAPKYKSILLNTFLSGVKDDDHLMRVSSLSNLGEVCRVLGYKLGSVVTEVLSCIHSVITTDEAVEARRAAVSVIRYLFVGLEKETIIFLKEDILPIYRTLKNVYTNDPDDVTRLQAQLALEELNNNVRELLFPKIKL